jgi:hypothetical protein
VIKEKLMRYAKVVSALCGVFFVFATVGASSALAAKDNPLWQLGSKIATEGVAMAVEGEANGEQTLTSAKLTIKCQKLTLNGAAEIIGSKLPESGKGKGKIRYKACSVSGSDETTCTINGAAIGKGEIETNALNMLEAYASKSAAEAEALTTEETVTVFKPSTGELFAEFTLAGTCPVSGKPKVEGSGVIVKNLGKNESLEVHEIEAPAEAKTKYFEWSDDGVVVEAKASLELAGEKATCSGKAKVKTDEPTEKFNLAI